jgi:hypothetical protein
MRFPIVLMHSERNDKLCSENAYNVFAKVASTKTTMFPDIAEGAKDSEN